MYSEEILKQLSNLGALGYSCEKCINVLDIEDEKTFEKDFKNPASIVGKAYQKGVDKADYAIDSKLFQKAREGDLKALEKYEQRKHEQKHR